MEVLIRSRILLLLPAVLLACAEEATQPVKELMPLAQGTVQVNVVAEREVPGLTVTTLMIEAEALELGAYQGRFRFDPAVLELVDESLGQHTP